MEATEFFPLVWGTIIMVCTGILLWFDSWFIQFLPKGTLDVALIVHFYEAWLALLAIIVWHLYSTVFHPHVYPMNPSWLTGSMPEEMYAHEHPEHLDEARAEERALYEKRMRQIGTFGNPMSEEGETIEEEATGTKDVE